GQTVALLLGKPAQTFAFGPEDQGDVRQVGGDVVQRAFGLAVQADAPVAEIGNVVQGAGQIGDTDQRHLFQGAGGGLGQSRIGFGTGAVGDDDGAGVERGGRAQNRSDIMRVGNPVEQQDDVAPPLDRFAGGVEIRLGQGVDQNGDALMHGLMAQDL